jgi:hypothetical protein
MEKVDPAGRLFRGVSPAAVESIEWIFSMTCDARDGRFGALGWPRQALTPDKAVSVNFNAKLNADTPAQDHAAKVNSCRLLFVRGDFSKQILQSAI